MGLELSIRPDAPIARPRYERAAGEWLRDPVKRVADLEGEVGTSTEVRLKPYFGSNAGGSIDRDVVTAVEIAVEVTDLAEAREPGALAPQ